jgi:FAD/FMN-containing dehydrogenase
MAGASLEGPRVSGERVEARFSPVAQGRSEAHVPIPQTRSAIVIPKAEELRQAIRGQVIEADDAAYDAARSIWNGMIDRRPAAIARCLGTADIQATLRHALEHDIPFTIRGGGHNIAGLSIADDALMIDLSAMRGAWLDRQRGAVRAQPGATLGDIDRETQLHSHAAVLGFVSNTGATGLTLGGGFGYLSRRYGWTCDNLRAVDMITAEGELVRATETVNPDLFWGLRGGGGNFGIVTGMEHKVYPVGPEIVGGLIAWRGEDAADVLELYRDVTASAPRELTCAALIRKAPSAPWLRQEVHGQLIVGIVLCHSGPVEQAEADIAAILGHGSPVGNVVQRRPYVTQQNLLDATQPNGRRYYWKAEYLPGLEDEALDIFRDFGERIASPHSAVILFALGGAIADLPDDHSPMGNRDARYVLNVTGAWDDADEDATHVGWTRSAWEAMRRFSTGGTYVNFLTEDDGIDRIRDAYGSHYERLAAVKATWDPNNVFRANKNIAPARS